MSNADSDPPSLSSSSLPIWSAGRWLDPTTPLVAAEDRAVIHGVGLFETLRTYLGRPLLWPRHQARLVRSARELGLPLDLAQLPDTDAMSELVRRAGDDVVIRVTLAGTAGGRSLVWMTGRLVPDLPGDRGVRAMAHFGWSAGPLARYKTLNYWPYLMAFERARRLGADEAILVGPPVFEGSRTNLLVVRGGLVTAPPTGCLPGVMSSLMLSIADGDEHPVLRPRIEWEDLLAADEIILTNSVWGMLPVSELVRPVAAEPSGDPSLIVERTFEVPGPITRRLDALFMLYLMARTFAPKEIDPW